jgi:PKD repeat protein
MILILYLAAWQVPAQTADAVYNTVSCSASFSSEIDPLNPMTVHFHDNSGGQITLWQWNFGDGSTSTTQNPVHTYASGGTYFVCLTVSNSDPLFTCHDVMCIAITIHEPGTCVADYHYTFDAVDQFKVRFTDLSTGNINRWHWNFGDGTYSDDRNPNHTFATFGKYNVCLTAYNSDSAATCTDVKCDTVAITTPAVCHADFVSELDTLNPMPNTYRFYSISSGEPNRFRWKFDDGFTSDAQHVTHHFQSYGTHEVCLVVKKEEHGVVVCADSTCKAIVSAKYFDLGGHMFAGSFPINNPVNQGDTGVVYLFRAEGTKLLPQDTSVFSNMGYYAFPKTLNGSYIIRAMLTPGSTHYAKYFPSYYGNTMHWKGAGILQLTDSNSYVSDIHMLSTADTIAGPGIIRGMVQRAYSPGNSGAMPITEVVVFNDRMNPVKFAFTDKWGQFEFTNMPYGAYQLYVEVPGKYSRLTSVWIDAAGPVADSIRLEVFNHDVTAVPLIAGQGIRTGDLFPNPAATSVSLQVELAQNTELKFVIRTLTGTVAWTGSINCHAGSNTVTVPLYSVKAGMYLFMINMPDGTLVAAKKLLRY